jgi:hypothetical protein
MAIIKDEVESLGLKIITGNMLERTKSSNLSKELNLIITIDYGELGAYMPDVDLIIYHPFFCKIIAVISPTYNDIVKLLKSLAFRFRKLFYSMNSIGIEHYFGNLKENSIDPTVVSKAVKCLREGDADISDLRGFIDPDNYDIGVFY